MAQHSFIYCGEEWYAFGRNDFGQLGLGHRDVILSPTKLAPPPNGGHWISFHCGSWSTIAVASTPNSEKRESFGFGYNENKQLALENSPIVNPTALPFASIHFVHFFCGFQTAFGQTHHHETYGFGKNEDANLGLGHDNSPVGTPTLVKAPSGHFTKISVGNYGSLALTSDKKMYSFGTNHFGQLGFEQDRQQYPPTLVECFTPNEHFVDVSTGDEFSVAHVSNGDLYSFGLNSVGQLGLSHKDSVKTPSLLGKFKKLVGSGADFTCAISNNDEIITFGNNADGQLGVGSREPKLGLQKVEIKNFKHVLVGYWSLIIQTKEDDFLICGCNQNAQLGVGDKENRSSPVELKSPNPNAKIHSFYHK